VGGVPHKSGTLYLFPLVLARCLTPARLNTFGRFKKEKMHIILSTQKFIILSSCHELTVDHRSTQLSSGVSSTFKNSKKFFSYFLSYHLSH